MTRPRGRVGRAVVAAVVAGFIVSSAGAAMAILLNGQLDSTFDGDGKVTTDFGGVEDRANAVAVQADGKIVAVGYRLDGASRDFALARYNPDGSLDATFDTDGMVTTDLGGNEDIAYAVLIQPDGKIVAAGKKPGSDTRDIALVRYNTDGSLDATFGTGGVVTTDVGSDNAAYALAYAGNGQILVGGYSNVGTHDDFLLIRYNANGSIDTSFGSGGVVTTNIPDGADNGYDYIHDISFQPDGRIVVAGLTYGEGNIALARYSPTGLLDTTFDGDGILVTALSGNEFMQNFMAIQPDGGIVVAGYKFNGSNWDYAVARYNGDGTADTTFSGDGLVTTDLGGTDFGQALLLQPTGRIIVGGRTGDADFGLVRYKADGSLDDSFNFPNGWTTTDFSGGWDILNALAMDTEGRIVAAGYATISGGTDFALARYAAFVPPTITTDAASNLTGTSATLNATVNANGYPATVSFDYGLDTGYGNTISNVQSPLTGTTDTAVSTIIGDLAPGTTYHYRVRVSNGGYGILGGDQMFTTLVPPTVTTMAASEITFNGATLNGTVNANGYATDVWFRYGPDVNCDLSVPASQSPVDGVEDTAVSAVLTGLTPGTTYHYYLMASNDGYSSGAGILTFNTDSSLTFSSVGSQDGWILESSETANAGGTLNAVATTIDVGDDASRRQFRAILGFDTSLLPDDAVITSATLRIRRKSLSAVSPFKALGSLLVDVRGGAFSGKPALQIRDFRAAASAGQVATISAVAVNGWHAAFLGPEDFGYLNLAGLTQFRLRFAKDDNNDAVANFLRFFSGNAAEVSRPRLIVTYVTVTP